MESPGSGELRFDRKTRALAEVLAARLGMVRGGCIVELELMEGALRRVRRRDTIHAGELGPPSQLQLAEQVAVLAAFLDSLP